MLNTPILYVLVSRDKDLYLEELWTSLYSLRQFHPEAVVYVLADDITSERILQRPALAEMITHLQVVPVPEAYSPKLRSREIKTSVRNLVQGDFLFIDTDTVIARPLDEVDLLDVKNLAMVPELHGPFRNHLFYDLTWKDTKRIFDIDASDSPYWFNSGCMLVRDNAATRDFFTRWHANWEHSALVKGNSSDQRALLATDKSAGFFIECLPDSYNCQVAMSIQHLYDACIVHFWHMRASFTSDLNYSPYCSKAIYRQIREDKGISPQSANLIANVKRSFATPSMMVGEQEVRFLFSSFYVVLGKAYRESRAMRTFLDFLIKYTNLYQRAKRKIRKPKA